MSPEPGDLAIRTPRLELVTLTASFVQALTAGDTRAAGEELGARVGSWLASDPSHVVQLHVADQAGVVAGFAGIGRVIVLRTASCAGQAIGSVGFTGPLDERDRLEVACRIHPAHRGHGYAAEALSALLDWATARFGITRFVVAVPSPREPWDLVPIEIGIRPAEPLDDLIDELAGLIETV